MFFFFFFQTCPRSLNLRTYSFKVSSSKFEIFFCGKKSKTEEHMKYEKHKTKGEETNNETSQNYH